jgi:hypothetical protein
MSMLLQQVKVTQESADAHLAAMSLRFEAPRESACPQSG